MTDMITPLSSTDTPSLDANAPLPTASALNLMTNFTQASHLLEADELERTVGHIIDYLDSVTVEDRIIVSLVLLKAQRLTERLMIRLGTDQIEVASILLEKRKQIPSAVLLEIAGHTGADHHRAIASRTNLASCVCTALIGAGHEAALVALAENRSAQIDSEGFARLAAFAGRFHLLRLPLTLRADTPEAALIQLKSTGSKTLGAYIDCVLDNRSKSPAVRPVQPDLSRLTDNLARLAHLSCETVDRVVGHGSVRALAMVARSIGMDRTTFDRFVDLVIHARGSEAAVGLPSEDDLATMFYELSPHEARLALEHNLVGY